MKESVYLVCTSLLPVLQSQPLYQVCGSGESNCCPTGLVSRIGERKFGGLEWSMLERERERERIKNGPSSMQSTVGDACR